jgi:hypothetical protein
MEIFGVDENVTLTQSVRLPMNAARRTAAVLELMKPEKFATTGDVDGLIRNWRSATSKRLALLHRRTLS